MVDPLPPLTQEQLILLFAKLRALKDRGYGEVRLVVDHGQVCFLQEIVSVDIRPTKRDQWCMKTSN
jgi:hypothetical protein